MKKYLVTWSSRENNEVTPLFNGKAEVEFDSLKDAETFVRTEIKKTDLQAIDELDFDPTEEEMRTNVVSLEIRVVNSEDADDLKIITASDYYWVD